MDLKLLREIQEGLMAITTLQEDSLRVLGRERCPITGEWGKTDELTPRGEI